jgi:drug/metabolite transporter (DMT)-like permease
MVEPWIAFTVGAALLQSVRTAGQKQLTAQLSVLAGTYVRSLIGLPVMLVYLLVIKGLTAVPWPALSLRFAISCLLTAVTQIAATMALLALYRLRNFAVVNQIGKSDMVFTAVIGSLVLGEVLSAAAWAALALTGAGVVTIMTARSGSDGPQAWRDVLASPAIGLGLFVGLMFGICNLTLRDAALSLDSPSAYMAGAMTVASVTAMQVAIMGAVLGLREPGTYRRIAASGRLAGFVGVTSGLGSIAWFTAFALETAAHVRIVGQIEVVFTLLISAFYFRERLTSQEGLGIALTIAGIILVQVAG